MADLKLLRHLSWTEIAELSRAYEILTRLGIETATFEVWDPQIDQAHHNLGLLLAKVRIEPGP